MAVQPPPITQVLEVKKYPNRRLYDATRSCHVTLAELYELVATGHTVRVRESKTGEDITNQVLLQALIERDPLKVGAVPSALIHMMVRLNHPLLASWFDLYVGRMMEAYRAAGGGQNWWSAWPTPGPAVPGAAAGPAAAALSPLDWMTSLMTPPADESEPAPEVPAAAAEVEALRREVAALATELATLRRNSATPRE